LIYSVNPSFALGFSIGIRLSVFRKEADILLTFLSREVRCFNCERKGIKIVHPYHESYQGRYDDFMEMAQGNHGFCNEDVIGSCDFYDDVKCTLKEDWIFYDPNMHSKISLENPIVNWARANKRLKNRIF
jgi:hypothetical protein